MKPVKIRIPAWFAFACCSWAGATAAEYPVRKVGADLSQVPKVNADYWQGVAEIELVLLGQMIANPKPAKAETNKAKVQIVHDGKYISYRIRWADTGYSEAGKLGEFSDAVALEFPVLDNAAPPPIMMGAPKNPVHLFHWRAMYQRDEVLGKKSVKDNYPNASVDIYPNEFPDRGKLKPATQEEMEVFSPAKALGNPQASAKRAVDEMMAEGFGTSVVTAGGNAVGRGEWRNGEWVVVISRALKCPGGSVLEAGKASSFGLAVWQGGAGEVGSRKALTMVWTPFLVEGK